MALPAAFIEDMSQVLPAAELEEFLRALTEGDVPTSIRWNEAKGASLEAGSQSVSWCLSGQYLTERPVFTLDPLLHAGVYYVQEASSQFITHVIRQIVGEQSTPLQCLDLCASPGGKSTAALSVLPKGSVLVSNEIDRKRARILAENIQKWGNPNVCVTANAPADFKGMNHAFDLIITDVPCSGEGMFRKDAGSIAEWNPAKVKECAALQRQIVSDIWDCLRPGGYLIYSTCTFNVHEDEENVQFIHDELGGEIVPVHVEESWHIHPAITGDFAPDVRPESACRFMPHYTQGEGLFMALIHKPGTFVKASTAIVKSGKNERHAKNNEKGPDMTATAAAWVASDVHCTIQTDKEGVVHAIPQELVELHKALIQNRLYLLSAGVELGVVKGKDLQPGHPLALSTALLRGAFPEAELDLDTALNYLRRESIVLGPENPRGYVLLTYHGYPLGFVKNIGNRCNSLYPTEWRIRNL